MTRGLSLLLIAALSAGCTVQALEDTSLEPTVNECTADADCGTGKCDPTLKLCRAEQGAFATVLFEITAPADADRYGGLSFLMPQEVAPSGGPLDLALGVVSKVTGSVKPQKADFQGSCEIGYGAANASLSPAVKVTFTSTMKLLGVPAPRFTAKTTYDAVGKKYEFEAWLPPDVYDVYVEPLEEGQNPDSCSVVPQLVRDVKIEAGDVEAQIPLQAPNLLEIEVLLPVAAVTSKEKTPLVGWEIDVIDPGSGLRLSAPTQLELVDDPTDVQNQHYTAAVEFSEATGENVQVGAELVRLRPPAGADKPTVVIERAHLGLFSTGPAKIEAQKQFWPEAVKLDQISVFGTNGQPFAGTATARFVSTKLEIDSGGGKDQMGLAFFEKTVEIVDGVAKDVHLLEGEYDVFVAPPASSGFATTKTKLTVSNQAKQGATQGGKSVTLELVSDVGGSVLTPGGVKAATGASVQAVAAPVGATPLEIAVDTKPFSPKATSGMVGKEGEFSFEVDPGVFDFSVRPPDGTGFAWLVRPGVEVKSGVHDLGPMTLPLPVIYEGNVSVPGSSTPVPLPGALIRAFIYLNAAGYTGDRTGATTAVQLAEARADSTGAFRLFLPANLN